MTGLARGRIMRGLLRCWKIAVLDPFDNPHPLAVILVCAAFVFMATCFLNGLV